MTKRGFKGTATGLGDDNNRKWMPEVLFKPQISGPVNRANCQPVEPVALPEQYDVFRKKGASDEG